MRSVGPNSGRALKNYLDIVTTKVFEKALDYFVGKVPKNTPTKKSKTIHVGDFFVKQEGDSKAKQINVYYKSNR